EDLRGGGAGEIGRVGRRRQAGARRVAGETRAQHRALCREILVEPAGPRPVSDPHRPFRVHRRLLLAGVEERVGSFRPPRLLGNHLDSQLGCDLPVQPHLDVVRSDCLDRLREVDGAPIDAVTLARERFGDVQSSDRSIELFLLADLAPKLQLHRLKLLRFRLSLILELLLARRDNLLVVLHLTEVFFIRHHRHLPRKKKVAAVSVLDGDNVARLAQFLNILSQDDFHRALPLAGNNHVGNERQTAGAFDRHRHLSLVPRAVSGDPPRDDLASLGDEVLERRLILKVHLGVFFRAEPADLLSTKAPPAAFFLVETVSGAARPAASARSVAVPATSIGISVSHAQLSSIDSSSNSLPISSATSAARKGSRSALAARPSSTSPANLTSSSVGRASGSTSSATFTER